MTMRRVLCAAWFAGAMCEACLPTVIFDPPICRGARCDAGADAGDVTDAVSGDAAGEDAGASEGGAADVVEAGVEDGGDGGPGDADAADGAADVACPEGQTRCGGACVSLRSDAMNCGECGRACAIPGASSVCVDGACQMTTCVAGLGDCDRSAANGCETNLGTSVTHCGRCGNGCAFPRARAACGGGTCGIDACETGWGNCDGDVANGCETDTQRSNAHCGRCGGACPSGQTCMGGTCTAPPEQRSCLTPGTPGCGLVEVAGGTFTMGTTTACYSPTEDRATCGVFSTPARPNIFVNSFAVDAYEVTVGRFRAFWAARAADGGASIRARPIAYPNGTTIAWTTMGQEPDSTTQCNWSRAPAGLEAHPVNCVTWWTAQEFCVWDGGRLPTEAEWEYTARGRAVPSAGLAAGRVYPWGDEAPSTSCDRAQWNLCSGEDGAATRRAGRFLPNGGVYDLAGNVEEWVADLYSPYSGLCWPEVGQRNPLCDPARATTMSRSLRGGSVYNTAAVSIRAASRQSSTDLSTTTSIGFRCLRGR